MKLNRKNVTWAIAGLALAGALVGGAGIAVAATGTPQTSAPSSTPSVDPPYGHMGGWAEMGDMEDVAGMAGMAFGQNSAMAAAADYLGMSLTDLRAQLHGGTSLADVAGAQGKSVDGLKDAMVAAMTRHLDANTALTAEEKATALTAMKSHLDEMVTATHSPGSGPGLMGSGMGSMMGR